MFAIKSLAVAFLSFLSAFASAHDRGSALKSDVVLKSPSRLEAPEAPALNYDDAIVLDAEDLAEGGIREAYEALLPALKAYVSHPIVIEERLDPETPRYSVLAGGVEYLIYDQDVDNSQGDLWGRATFVFFKIINDQLRDSPVRFYALNGGNELDGIFLTTRQFEAARKSLERPSDWPYLPTDERPAFGQLR